MFRGAKRSPHIDCVILIIPYINKFVNIKSENKCIFMLVDKTAVLWYNRCIFYEWKGEIHG